MTTHPPSAGTRGDLFRHVSAERAAVYRAILEAFAAAKRQLRLHLRPDEMRAEARWAGGEAPEPEVVVHALGQLVEWGICGRSRTPRGWRPSRTSIARASWIA